MHPDPRRHCSLLINHPRIRFAPDYVVLQEKMAISLPSAPVPHTSSLVTPTPFVVRGFSRTIFKYLTQGLPRIVSYLFVLHHNNYYYYY